tara:strand:- start:808 stop:1974 length:1167 start_codon:yes stop_codon:yes gene_type:complete
MTYGHQIKHPGKNKRMIRLSKSCICEDEKKAVKKILDKEFLGMGPEVKSFEDELSEFFGRDAVCVVNGTAALHLALQAIGVSEGDEIIVPSLTYLASFQAITASGAIPVPCDIEKETFNIDPAAIKKLINSKTKAIMPVFYAGGVGNLEDINDIARLNNIRVVEDAAHAFGTQYKNKRIGSFGDISCFSFDGIKNITSGEGGCIVADDKDVLNKIRNARLLGVENDTEKRFNNDRSWIFDVKEQGWRYHMSDIMAAIGRIQLRRFDELKFQRQKLATKYQQILGSDPRIKLLKHNYDDIVPHIYVIQLLDNIAFNEIKEYFLQKGIHIGRHYMPNHKLSFFSGSNKDGLENTLDIAEKIITLPLHPDLSIQEVDYICETLKGFLDLAK